MIPGWPKGLRFDEALVVIAIALVLIVFIAIATCFVPIP